MISNEKKLDGIGDPMQHVRRYLSIAKMKGLDEKQFCMHFLSYSQKVHQGGIIVWILARKGVE